jgi:hypothetical protein
MLADELIASLLFSAEDAGAVDFSLFNRLTCDAIKADLPSTDLFGLKG